MLFLILLLLGSPSIAFNFLRPSRFFSITDSRIRPQQIPSSQLKFITLDDVPVLEKASDTATPVHVISEAQYSDLHAVVSLRVQVFYPDLQDVKSFHTKVLDKLRFRRSEGTVCLIVTKQGGKQETSWNYFSDIVGTVEFSASDFKNSSLEAATGRETKLYLMDLAVRADSRKKGIASMLLKSAEKYAAANGYDEILLHVDVGNVRALKLYEKHGYQEYPVSDKSIHFTESRLHKPASCYIFLHKHIQRDATHST